MDPHHASWYFYFDPVHEGDTHTPSGTKSCLVPYSQAGLMIFLLKGPYYSVYFPFEQVGCQDYGNKVLSVNNLHLHHSESKKNSIQITSMVSINTAQIIGLPTYIPGYLDLKMAI